MWQFTHEDIKNGIIHFVASVDDVIKEMMAVDRPVIVDVAVDQKENCFPMIPSGRAHYEMILGDEDSRGQPTITDAGLALV